MRRFTLKNYTKIVIIVLFIMISAFLLINSGGKIRGDIENISAGNDHHNVDDVKVNYSVNDLVGRVVYERPDGIYLTDLFKKESTQLVKVGKYPRWAPDGSSIAFVRNNTIMMYELQTRKQIKLAQAEKARAVCYAQNGEAVLFTDGKFVRQVDLRTLKIKTLLKNERFLELDISHNGKKIAATVKTLTGFKVIVYEYPGLVSRTVARGCSASLSPEGNLVTVNGGDHTFLSLYATSTLREVAKIQAPQGKRFDNQFWSNHPNWLVATSEGDNKDIFIHHVNDGSSRRVTFSGDCDRADLFIPFVRS